MFRIVFIAMLLVVGAYIGTELTKSQSAKVEKRNQQIENAIHEI